MNRILKLFCPKDTDKRYFSWSQHKYKNNLTVCWNNNVLFEKINDAEELLPINLIESIHFDTTTINTLSLIYDITFDQTKEQATVDFVFEPSSSMCTANFFRKNFVEGSEYLTDDYNVTLDINNQVTMLDKTFHEGDTKKLSIQNFVDMDLPIVIKLQSKKVFAQSSEVTYDQIELHIQ